MLPIITVPTAQQAAPPQAVNLAVVAPVPVQASANVVHQAVPANSSPVALYNNVRGGAATSRLSGQEAAPAADTVPQRSRDRAGRQGAFPAPGFSSAFLAQALAQSDPMNDNALFLATDYRQPESPTPEQAVLERFALTRYQPSQAARPQTSVGVSLIQHAAFASYAATLERNTANRNLPSVQRVI